MGIENFGKVSFTTESKAAEFVANLEQGKVTGTRCRDCGATYFPPKMDCPGCLSSNVEWFEITDTGTLATYSVVTYGPSGFEDDAPYTLAVADFGAFKVFGRICKDIPSGDLSVGMKVKIVPVRLADGKFSYEFLKA